jgi:hypothetical protein
MKVDKSIFWDIAIGAGIGGIAAVVVGGAELFFIILCAIGGMIGGRKAKKGGALSLEG